MKWEPVAAMVLLLGLGAWIVYRPAASFDLREGAYTSRLQLGSERGEVEVHPEPTGDYTFRLLLRNGFVSPVYTAGEFKRAFGDATYAGVTESAGNVAFRVMNVTSWAGVAWVLFGLVGQLAFAGRWLIQWFISEKRKESFIPASFWWTSMLAGAVLFAYFAWRQDLVGVLGQVSGIVVYARNIRLIKKKARRDAKEAAKREGAMSEQAAIEKPDSEKPDR